MILFFMTVLLILTFTAGIEAIIAQQAYGKRRAALAGVAFGGLAWNAYLYWPAFLPLSIALLVLAVALAVFQALRGDAAKLRRMFVAGAITLGTLLISWQGILVGLVNAEVVSDPRVLNAQGAAGRAYIVYHPGRTGFPELLMNALAESLARDGWRVEVTTASSEAPTDLTGYDLLVLGTPTYDWLPARRLLRYMDRLGTLDGIPAAAIVTGEGYTRLSEARMAQRIDGAGGDLLDVYPVWLLAPNTMRYGTGDYQAIMHQVAADLVDRLAP